MRLRTNISILTFLLFGCSNPKQHLMVVENDYEVNITKLDTEKMTDAAFELTINEYNESQDYFVRYILSKDTLKLTKGAEMRTKKDAIIYSNSNFQKDKIKQFLKIEIDSLSGYHANICISGGDIKSFTIKNNNKSKAVRLDNYYHEDLSPAIEFINEIVPEKYKLNYNKRKLIDDIEACNKKYALD